MVSVAPQNMGSSTAGIEPMSPATAGGSLSIAPPGEVPAAYFLSVFLFYLPFFFFFFFENKQRSFIQNLVHQGSQPQLLPFGRDPKADRGVRKVYAAAAAAAKSLQSCPTLCDPRDGSPPGSPFPGILQARTLEWVAISFSNA